MSLFERPLRLLTRLDACATPAFGLCHASRGQFDVIRNDKQSYSVDSSLQRAKPARDYSDTAFGLSAAKPRPTERVPGLGNCSHVLTCH
jgi:hypothetical protein